MELTADELSHIVDLVLERDFAQLRDELASMQQRAERAEKERDEAKQYSKNVERARDQSMLNESALLTRVDVANQKLERMTKERDEALAKLEQPRMVMRDNGQLWEVFEGDGTTAKTGTQYLHHGSFLDKIPGDKMLFGNLYRRPITPQELQAWITTDAKPVGYVNKHFPSDEYTTGCIVRDEEQGYTIPVYLHPPQPQVEVLFEGVRYIDKSGWNTDRLLLVEPNGVRSIPVHVTIRKAGE